MLFLVDQSFIGLNPEFTKELTFYGHKVHKIYRIPYKEQGYSIDFLYPNVTKRFHLPNYSEEWLANFNRNLNSIDLEDMAFYSLTSEMIYEQVKKMFLTDVDPEDDLRFLFKNLLKKDDYSERTYHAGCGFVTHLVIKALRINHIQYSPHYVCVGYQSDLNPAYKPRFRFFICKHVEVTSPISNTVSYELQFLGWLR